MAEKIKRGGRIDVRGVVVFGATVEELGVIQDLLGGDGTIDANPSTGEVIVRQRGVSKLEVAETIEGVMDVLIDGIEDLRVTKMPAKIHGRRVESIKTRDSNRHAKLRG